MPRFSVHRVDINDTLVQQTIHLLHADCYPVDDPYRPTAGEWWLVRYGREEVAFGGIVASHQFPGFGYLCRAGVLPAFRGRGLQARLIRARVKHAIERGWTTVVTDTRQNPASANSLINCGFKTYAPPYPWSFSDAIYWRKTLPKVRR